MTSLICPDIHLKHKQLEKTLSELGEDNYDEVVFLGDYFHNYGDSILENKSTANWLAESLLTKTKRIHLCANHDLCHVSNHPFYRCPGYTPDKDKAIRECGVPWNLLKAAHASQGFVFSHAGFHKSHIGDMTAGDAVDYANKEYEKVLDDRVSYLFQSGARMGDYCIGGITWLDWEQEFEPLDNFRQIVGHSFDKMIREKSGNYCIDCDLRYLLEIVDGELYSIDRHNNLKRKKL